MLKMIVTDIDGTLVEAGQNYISEAYYDIIKKLTDRGILFIAASGRHLSSLSHAFEPVLDRIGMITQNGAVIETGGKSRVIQPIPKVWVRELWEDLSNYEKADSVICSARKTFCPFYGSQMYDILTGEYQYDTLPMNGWNHLPEEEISMMTLFHPEDAEKFCREHIQEKWSGRLDIYSTGQIWVDLLMPSVNKGTAMKVLCEEYGVLPEETISFGDNMNDIPMIRFAGTGYAVDSARKEVQDAADRVIPGVRSDGVLHELERILEGLK